MEPVVRRGDLNKLRRDRSSTIGAVVSAGTRSRKKKNSKKKRSAGENVAAIDAEIARLQAEVNQLETVDDRLVEDDIPPVKQTKKKKNKIAEHPISPAPAKIARIKDRCKRGDEEKVRAIESPRVEPSVKEIDAGEATVQLKRKSDKAKTSSVIKEGNSKGSAEAEPLPARLGLSQASDKRLASANNSKKKTRPQVCHKIFIGDLPWSLSEEKVRTHFATFGEIDRFDMPKNNQGLPDGVAFVYYKTEDAMRAALSMHGCDFHGRQIKVKQAVPQNNQGKPERESGNSNLSEADRRTIYVSGLSVDTDIDVLKKHFSECGELDSIRPLKDNLGRFKGTAFIVFKMASAAQAALKRDGTPYGGRKLIVRKVDNKGKGKGEGKSAERPKGKGTSKGDAPTWNADHDRTVFVGSLREDVGSRNLQQDFGECGEIESIRILKDKEGFSKGAAFIVFRNKSGAKEALEWDGEYYFDRCITVSMTRPKKAKDEQSTAPPE